MFETLRAVGTARFLTGDLAVLLGRAASGETEAKALKSGRETFGLCCKVLANQNANQFNDSRECVRKGEWRYIVGNLVKVRAGLVLLQGVFCQRVFFVVDHLHGWLGIIVMFKSLG